METIIRIAGMSCQHCERAVKEALLALPGVRAVQVDLEAGSAAISYDQAQVSLDEMKAAIEGQGYDVP
ncbi:MAG: heavy-metal-associated domain-containing protein [Clostridiales bacterium]|nr:heavy-metal-associated domain-containing protein [Clostridiales bacterium]